LLLLLEVMILLGLYIVSTGPTPWSTGGARVPHFYK